MKSTPVQPSTVAAFVKILKFFKQVHFSSSSGGDDCKKKMRGEEGGAAAAGGAVAKTLQIPY